MYSRAVVEVCRMHLSLSTPPRTPDKVRAIPEMPECWRLTFTPSFEGRLTPTCKETSSDYYDLIRCISSSSVGLSVREVSPDPGINSASVGYARYVERFHMHTLSCPQDHAAVDAVVWRRRTDQV